MTRKHVHTPVFRGVSIVLSILCMWGFGITLLLVFMNISIGFADNDANFRQAFLEQTIARELSPISLYVETGLHSP